MVSSLFESKQVVLNVLDPEKDAATMASWTDDPEYQHLTQFEPARPITAAVMRKKLEEQGKSRVPRFDFGIHSCQDNRLVGTVSLKDVEFSNGSAWLELAIGKPEDRSQGYGSEALALILRYAFEELNLHGVWVMLAEYNQTCANLLNEHGFSAEARQRQALERNGELFDILILGVREEAWRKSRQSSEATL